MWPFQYTKLFILDIFNHAISLRKVNSRRAPNYLSCLNNYPELVKKCLKNLKENVTSSSMRLPKKKKKIARGTEKLTSIRKHH